MRTSWRRHGPCITGRRPLTPHTVSLSAGALAVEAARGCDYVHWSGNGGSALAPSLDRWAAFLPVATCSDRAADLLGLRNDVDLVSAEEWREALERIDGSDHAEGVGPLYGMACRRADAPPAVRCRVGATYAIAPTDKRRGRPLGKRASPADERGNAGDLRRQRGRRRSVW